MQVLDIENISISRWEQIEELEAIERGERTRGREIIRVTDQDEQGDDDGGPRRNFGDGGGGGGGKNATHKLVLQDFKGNSIFAMEMKRIDKIGVGKMLIGEKMVLKAGTVVARGVVLLTPENVVMLGGKIDAWHKSWVESRLARLKESVGGDRPG